MTEPVGVRMRRRRVRRIVWWSVAGVLIVVVAALVWVGVQAFRAKSELEAAMPLAEKVQSQLAAGDARGAKATAERMAPHLRAARDASDGILWRAAEVVPFLGPNLSAVRNVAAVASDVTDDAVIPLAKVAETVPVTHLDPSNLPLRQLAEAAPAATKANATVQSGLATMRRVNTDATLSPVTSAVQKLRGALQQAAGATDALSRAARLLPGMLGQDGPRRYLVLVQNNAEARSSGGIVGALALLEARGGKLNLVQQASAADLPVLSKPVLPLPAGTRALYGERPAEYVQDVTMTPDFPLTARLARAMWQQRFGGTVDGVVSIDPVALAHLLAATGPVTVDGRELTSDDAVSVLLSQVYAAYEDSNAQDAFFQAAAAAVFAHIASGSFDAKSMLSALSAAIGEHRILVWSAHPAEQAVLSGAAITGTLAESAPFGVYLNDATGAKMDYYLRTSIELGHASCRTDGRVDYLIRVTLKNTAPADAATALPWQVTGGGLSGVPAGETHTTLAVYAPAGAVISSVTADDRSVAVRRATDAGHPVGQLLVKLNPGESAGYDFHIVGPIARVDGDGVRATPGVHASSVHTTRVICAQFGH